MLPERRCLALAAAALCLASAAGCVEAGHADVIEAKGTFAAGLSTHIVSVGSLDRSYLLHVPSAPPRRLGRALPFPLVLVLHGSGADAETVRRMSGMDSLSDARRFVLAYPNGTSGLLRLRSDWNAGTCCGPASERHVDDVGFVRAVIADISNRLPIDRQRVYVAGFSDGGRMTYRLGCEMSGDIAAIGVVSGGLMDTVCNRSRQVPLIAFHGTTDDEVPFADTLPRSLWRARYDTLPRALPPVIGYWASMNGCGTRANARVSTHVVRWTFGRCGGADVVFYGIENGGHAWPGGKRDGAGDEPTPEINASALMTQFFLTHARTGDVRPHRLHPAGSRSQR